MTGMRYVQSLCERYLQLYVFHCTSLSGLSTIYPLQCYGYDLYSNTLTPCESSGANTLPNLRLHCMISPQTSQPHLALMDAANRTFNARPSPMQTEILILSCCIFCTTKSLSSVSTKWIESRYVLSHVTST